MRATSKRKPHRSTVGIDVAVVCLALAPTVACTAIVGVESVSVGEDAGAPQHDGTVADVERRDRAASDADATMHRADALPPDARGDHVGSSDAHADRGEPVDARNDHAEPSTDARPDQRSETGTHDSGAHDAGTPDTGMPSLTYPEVVLADKPVAYWRLGELSGTTAADATGDGYSGQYASCALGKPGAIKNDLNTAVGFDGDGGTEVDLGMNFDFSGEAAFTVEAWIKPVQVDDVYRPIFVHEGYITGMEYQGYGLLVDGTAGLSFERFVAGAKLAAASPTAPPTHEFTYVVGVYTGPANDGGSDAGAAAGQLILYVNADVAGVGPQDTRTATSLNAHAFIGSYGPGAADYVAPFNGTIDEVAIYSYALPPSHILQHFKVGTGAPP